MPASARGVNAGRFSSSLIFTSRKQSGEEILRTPASPVCGSGSGSRSSKRWIFIEDAWLRKPGCQAIEHHAYRDPRTSHARLAMADDVVNADHCQEIVLHNATVAYALRNIFLSRAEGIVSGPGRVCGGRASDSRSWGLRGAGAADAARSGQQSGRRRAISAPAAHPTGARTDDG